MEGPYALKLASELGIQGIQLDIGTNERGFLLSYTVVQEAYLEMSKKFDVQITSLAVRELDNYGLTRENGTKEKEIAIESVMTAIDIADAMGINNRSEEHTSELQSRGHLVCRLLLEKKNK